MEHSVRMLAIPHNSVMNPMYASPLRKPAITRDTANNFYSYFSARRCSSLCTDMGKNNFPLRVRYPP